MINQTVDNIINQLHKAIFSLKDLQDYDTIQMEDLKIVLRNIESAYHLYLLLYNSLTGSIMMSGYMPVKKDEKKKEEKNDKQEEVFLSH